MLIAKMGNLLVWHQTHGEGNGLEALASALGRTEFLWKLQEIHLPVSQHREAAVANKGGRSGCCGATAMLLSLPPSL